MANKYYRVGKLLEGHKMYGLPGVVTAADASAKWLEMKWEACEPAEQFAKELGARAVYITHSGEWVGITWRCAGTTTPSKDVDELFCKQIKGQGWRRLRLKPLRKEQREALSKLQEKETNAKRQIAQSAWAQLEMERWDIVGHSRLSFIFSTASMFPLGDYVYASLPKAPQFVEFEEILASEYEKAEAKFDQLKQERKQ